MSVDLVDIGEVDAVDAGGVGIDGELRLFVDAVEATGLPALAAAACVGGLLPLLEEEEEEDVSFNPQEARTRFSTLTVSSRNINDSWSL